MMTQILFACLSIIQNLVSCTDKYNLPLQQKSNPSFDLSPARQKQNFKGKEKSC